MPLQTPYLVDAVHGINNDNEAQAYLLPMEEGYGCFYALRGSRNVNFTHEPLDEQTYDNEPLRVEEINDSAGFLADDPIMSACSMSEEVLEYISYSQG